MSKVLASCFGVGFLPWMPGTWGTCAAFLFVTSLLYGFAHLPALHIAYILLGTGLFLTFLGFFVCKRIFKNYFHQNLQAHFFPKGHFDPSWIVIDEIAGYFFATGIVAFWYSLTLLHLLTLFIVFRILDIQKPWPIGSIEHFCGTKKSLAPYGVMIDDTIAGIFSGFIVLLVFHFF